MSCQMSIIILTVCTHQRLSILLSIVYCNGGGFPIQSGHPSPHNDDNIMFIVMSVCILSSGPPVIKSLLNQPFLSSFVIHVLKRHHCIVP